MFGQRSQPAALPLRSPLNVGRIGDDCHPQRPVGRRRIVGDHDQVHDLRPQPLNHMRHHGPPTELAQRLWHARPHAPALAAGQDDANQRA